MCLVIFLYISSLLFCTGDKLYKKLLICRILCDTSTDPQDTDITLFFCKLLIMNSCLDQHIHQASHQSSLLVPSTHCRWHSYIYFTFHRDSNGTVTNSDTCIHKDMYYFHSINHFAHFQTSKATPPIAPINPPTPILIVVFIAQGHREGVQERPCKISLDF